MEHTVLCRNVSKVYRQDAVAVQALTNVNLEIPRLDFVCLSGPSGSGKSTLLNLIGGLDRPTRGEIYVDGNRVDQMEKGALAELRLRRIGFVFQAYNLIPVLTARENVEFVMQLQGVAAGERTRKAREILKEVGLEDLEDRRPGELSGGQQQRVAVARAIVSEPSLVLADEPTANLDHDTAIRIIELMKSMRSEFGTTFVFSTHDPKIMAEAETTFALEDGKLSRNGR